MIWKVERASITGKKSILRVSKGIGCYEWSAGGEGWQDSGEASSLWKAKFWAVLAWVLNR